MTPLQQLKATNLRKAENLEALIRADPTIAGSQLARIVGYIGLYRRLAHELDKLHASVEKPKNVPTMTFKDKHNDGFYKAKKGGFEFTVSSWETKEYYVVASHLKKDIRLNTLWKRLTFPEFDDAVSFCETFNHKEHRTIGEDSFQPSKTT
jgi:hypothetical protein